MAIQFPGREFPGLQTQRLQLRSVAATDSEAIFALRSNEEVNRFVGRKAAQTIDDAAQFIQDRLLDAGTNQGVYWAIELKSTGKLIGTICYWNINADENSAEIGYELLPEMQGKGLMQEAITAVIDWGFTDMNLDVITAFPLGEHDRSVNLLEKNKFTYNEINNGHLVYKLTRQTWLTSRQA